MSAHGSICVMLNCKVSSSFIREKHKKVCLNYLSCKNGWWGFTVHCYCVNMRNFRLLSGRLAEWSFSTTSVVEIPAAHIGSALSFPLYCMHANESSRDSSGFVGSDGNVNINGPGAAPIPASPLVLLCDCKYPVINKTPFTLFLAVAKKAKHNPNPFYVCNLV